MTRSYLTYKQMVVLAVLELQQDRDSSCRGRSFTSRKINNKIHDFAQAEGVHLSSRWKGYVKRAIAALVDANVLHKSEQGGRFALSSRGVRDLARSCKHFGSLDTLSPFKKSQFLKPIVGTSRKTSSSESTSQLVQTCTSQEKVIATLRDSLAKFKNINKSIAIELEDTKKERDDLQLTLLDMKQPLGHPSQSGDTAVVRFSHTSNSSTSPTPLQSHPETIRSDRDSSPVTNSITGPSSPSRLPLIDTRPTAFFTHRPSGSFLNTVSNQFTPSPSPAPVEPGTTTIIPTTHSNDDDEESEPFDLGDVEMIDAVGDYEDDTVVEKRMDSDVSHGQEMQNDSSDKTLDFTSEHTESRAQSLKTTEQLVVANRDREVVKQKLVSVTQERDSLQCDNAGLHTKLKGCNDQCDTLKNDLVSAAEAFDVLKAQKDACEKARVVTEAENLRVSSAIGKHISEVTTLTDRIAELSADLDQSNGQRDDTDLQLSSTSAQLEATKTQLWMTHAELAATQVQLGGIQRDLRTIWQELQTSKEQHDEVQKELSSARAQFDAIRLELDTVNVRMEETSAQLRTSINQLQDSNLQLDANNAHLGDMRSDLQGLQNALAQSQELERRLHNELADVTGNLADSQQAAQQSIARENDLKSQLEEAQERITILEEDLQAVQDAWTRAAEMKRAVAEADNEVQQTLFRQRVQRRDPSFRDSGVSMIM